MSGTDVIVAPVARQPVRPLLIGLVAVLSVVGGVFVLQSVPRWQWADGCRDGGGQVASHAGGREPYLAPGSSISWTCEGPEGLRSSWP